MLKPLPIHHSKGTPSEPERAFLTYWRLLAPMRSFDLAVETVLDE